MMMLMKGEISCIFYIVGFSCIISTQCCSMQYKMANSSSNVDCFVIICCAKRSLNSPDDGLEVEGMEDDSVWTHARIDSWMHKLKTDCLHAVI